MQLGFWTACLPGRTLQDLVARAAADRGTARGRAAVQVAHRAPDPLLVA